MSLVCMDADLCTGCGLCVMTCGRKLIEILDGLAVVKDPSRCSRCGHCKSVCPVDAPQLAGLDPADVVQVPSRKKMPLPHDLLGFMRSRRSIRNFTDRAVDRKTAFEIINAGRYAPTAQNRQALNFVAVIRPETVEDLRSLTITELVRQADRLDQAKTEGLPLSVEDARFQDYPPAWRYMAALRSQGIDPLFHAAPSVVICHVNPIESLHPEVEAGMAAIQMALMAETLGLGTCFCGMLDYAASHSPELKRLLGIPQDHMVPISFILGYPAVLYRHLPARNPARIQYI